MISRRNNDGAGVTGLLYTDGMRFLQVLEGEQKAVSTTFERIQIDPRHHALVVLSDREIDERQFGKWAMAYQMRTDSDETLNVKLGRMLADAPAHIRQTFVGLVAARRAAC